ncbi:MAG TPA: hypothetical protein VHX88_06570 [Solirubrobacteraceae bacterium]|nr:hypothetical protein [Solirubrobacteraceae bacterium]
MTRLPRSRIPHQVRVAPARTVQKHPRASVSPALAQPRQLGSAEECDRLAGDCGQSRGGLFWIFVVNTLGVARKVRRVPLSSLRADAA